MLILADPRPLKKDRIDLPERIRGSLYLDEGTLYYCVLQNQATENDHLELITTTIPPEYWGDMWRIEFETEDRPGNTALLFGLLQDRQIEILNFESCFDPLSRKHISAVLLSARNYASARDLDYRERLLARNFELVELKEDILIYFWDQFAVNPDQTPRVKIRRMKTFRRLFADFQDGSRFRAAKSGQTYSKSGIQLSEKAINHLHRTLKAEQFMSASIVDTKDRLIRTLIFGQSPKRIHSCQLAYPARSAEMLSALTQCLYEIGGNIVRCRIGPLSARLGTGSATPFPDEELIRVARIEFDFPNMGLSEDSLLRNLAQLEERLDRAAEKAGATACFLERSWRET